MYVVELDNRIIGFSHVVPGEIVGLFVHPEFSKQGVGTLLIKHAMQKARVDYNGPIKIEATLNAQEFYEKFGFKKASEIDVNRNNVKIRIVVLYSEQI